MTTPPDRAALIEVMARARNPKLFSDGQYVAHMAAYPLKVEHARAAARIAEGTVLTAMEAAGVTDLTPYRKDKP